MSTVVHASYLVKVDRPSRNQTPSMPVALRARRTYSLGAASTASGRYQVIQVNLLTASRRA